MAEEEEVPQTVYTLKEVSQRNDNSSCWVVIHGKVYDVTEYLEDHPGGEDILLSVAGQEATEEFEDQGHSETARNILKKFEIGICEEKDENKQARAKAQEEFPPIRENTGMTTILRLLLPILIVALAIFYAYYKSTNSV
eukprot:g4837.t1